MAVKYIKDHKTQETVYPITKSECIIDAHSISGIEIDQLFDDSVNNSEVQESGMNYLNYDGLKHYHKKILEGVKTDLENVQVDLTGYATESWVKEQNYLTEHQDISNKVDSSDFEEVSQSLSESIENLSEEIFKRDFSTSSIDAQANSGDGITYFTPDTHQIIKDGVVYGQANLTGYATEQWVENKGYLTEHQDISGKVDITDFEEATLVTSAALNTLNQDLAAKESDIQLLQAQVLELQNQISTLIGHYNELENIIG